MPEYIPPFLETPVEEMPAGMGKPDAEWFRFYILAGKINKDVFQFSGLFLDAG